MKRKKKSFTITLAKKKPSMGHHSHRGGSGQHDNRPRKLRTRSDRNMQAIKECY